MKSTIFSILLAMILVYSLGHIADHWLDFNVHMDGEMLDPLLGGMIACLIAVILVMIGFFLAASFIGVLLFAIFAAVIGLTIAGFGLFWPIFVVLFCLYLLCRDNKQQSM